jgi:hypothetical protein
MYTRLQKCMDTSFHAGLQVPNPCGLCECAGWELFVYFVENNFSDIDNIYFRCSIRKWHVLSQEECLGRAVLVFIYIILV